MPAWLIGFVRGGSDIYGALKPDGKLLLVEPAGHVSPEELQTTLVLAKVVGFALESPAPIQRSHAAVIVKSPGSSSLAE